LRIAVALLLVLILGAAACGAERPDVDVAAAPPAEPPGPEAFLADGGWPEVAAFVREDPRPVVPHRDAKKGSDPHEGHGRRHSHDHRP
jgi:hypothetical protein